MSLRVPVRRSAGHVRRQRTVRRASPRLAPARAAAALVMLAAAAAGYGLTASPAFAVRDVAYATPPTFTDPTAVRSALGLTGGAAENIFRLATDDLAARLAALPSVAAATVSVALPGTLRVDLTEREPIMVWQIGGRRLLADAGGRLFSLPASAAGEARVARLPTIGDQRAASSGLQPGDRLDPLDVDVATRLASLKPADVGSSAKSLAVVVDDSDGFTLRALPAGWIAVFGFYAPDLRDPGIVPGQVRLLKSLLAGRETTIARVVLASDRSGTYTTR